MEVGDTVRTPEGLTAEVLEVGETHVLVRLDGDATGSYPAGTLEREEA